MNSREEVHSGRELVEEHKTIIIFVSVSLAVASPLSWKTEQRHLHVLKRMTALTARAERRRKREKVQSGRRHK